MSINYLAVPVLLISLCFPSIILIGLIILDYCVTKTKQLLLY